MKKLKQNIVRIGHLTLRFIRRFKRQYQDQILACLGLMSILLIVALCAAPKGERVYKSEIVQASMQSQILESRIEIWEQKIWEAQRQISENDHRISLLSKVFNSQK